MANKSNKNSNQSSQKIPVPLASLPAVLLPWYDREKRSLPWRDIVTPYRTWVSEIMLQQTRVQAVLPYFERFMAAAPDVPALAELAEDRLLSLWQGLGYYSRVRNMKKCAQVCVERHDGELPHTRDALLELPGYPKLLGVTDGGMIPNPDLEGKKAIAHNAVAMFHGLGYERPLVSAVCAAENVSPKIIETVDAAALKQAALEGAFGPCYVEGPISLDLALSRESAQIKGYESPVTGETDILLVPGMAAGNMMVKSLVLFAGARMVGVVTGAKCPIALNSRSASFEEKYHSLLVCALMSSSREENAE